MSKKIKNGDFVVIASPVDGKKVIALAIVTLSTPGGIVEDTIHLQESDELDTTASYEYDGKTPYEVLGNVREVAALWPFEYRAVLKEMTEPCGPLVTMRAVYALSQEGAINNREGAHLAITQSLQEDANRVAIFSAKIEQFTRSFSESSKAA